MKFILVQAHERSSYMFSKKKKKKETGKTKNKSQQTLMLKGAWEGSAGQPVNEDAIQGYDFRRREAEFLQVKIQTRLNLVMQQLLYLKSDEVDMKLQAILA